MRTFNNMKSLYSNIKKIFLSTCIILMSFLITSAPSACATYRDDPNIIWYADIIFKGKLIEVKKLSEVDADCTKKGIQKLACSIPEATISYFDSIVSDYQWHNDVIRIIDRPSSVRSAFDGTIGEVHTIAAVSFKPRKSMGYKVLSSHIFVEQKNFDISEIADFAMLTVPCGHSYHGTPKLYNELNDLRNNNWFRFKMCLSNLNECFE